MHPKKCFERSITETEEMTNILSEFGSIPRAQRLQIFNKLAEIYCVDCGGRTDDGPSPCLCLN